jgi:hypothetical protein
VISCDGLVLTSRYRLSLNSGHLAGIRPEARMARRWMAQLAGAHRNRWMAGARNATRAQQHEAKECRHTVRSQLLQRFPDADTEWTDPSEHPLPPWEIAGET